MIYSFRIFAIEGGLISFAADYNDLFRRAAGYVDKILNGFHPADLPVEPPRKFGLTVNLNTARSLGIEIPPAILARADEVIDQTAENNPSWCCCQLDALTMGADRSPCPRRDAVAVEVTVPSRTLV